MSSGSSKPPKAPDPQVVIDAQTRANRVNQVGPYGTSTFSTDANGNATQTSELSPELQAVYQRLLGQVEKEPEMAQQYHAPQGFDQLTSAVGSRVGQRYGLDSTKPTQQPMQKPMQMGAQSNRSSQSANNNALASMSQRQAGG